MSMTKEHTLSRGERRVLQVLIRAAGPLLEIDVAKLAYPMDFEADASGAHDSRREDATWLRTSGRLRYFRQMGWAKRDGERTRYLLTPAGARAADDMGLREPEVVVSRPARTADAAE